MFIIIMGLKLGCRNCFQFTKLGKREKTGRTFTKVGDLVACAVLYFRLALLRRLFSSRVSRLSSLLVTLLINFVTSETLQLFLILTSNHDNGKDHKEVQFKSDSRRSSARAANVQLIRPKLNFNFSSTYWWTCLSCNSNVKFKENGSVPC